MAPRTKIARTAKLARPTQARRTAPRGRPVGSGNTAPGGAIISPLLGYMILDNQSMIMGSLRLIELHLGFGTQGQRQGQGQQTNMGQQHLAEVA